MPWKHPNTITGSVAEGAKYFRRKSIEDRIWREIEKGNHVLFLAPRRVGKSSIVKYMSKNPNKFFIGLYKDIESDSSIQAFYKRLVNMTLEVLETSGWFKQQLKIWNRKWSLKSIGEKGFELEKSEIDYRSVFFEMLNDLTKLKENQRIVLFLDEIPDVIKKIYENSGVEEGRILIDDLRSLRNNDDFNKVFVLVLLGSVGLNHMVKKITGRTDKINDLHIEYLSPLKLAEVDDFIEHLINDATMKMDENTRKHLIAKLGHYIPYFIQLIIEECDDLLYIEERSQLTVDDIDHAYSNLLKKNSHFSDWEIRLKEYFPQKFDFLMQVLVHCALNGKITIQEIYNLAIANECKYSYKASLDDILVADGYLFEENGSYYFNSPLLRDWWKLRHPIA